MLVIQAVFKLSKKKWQNAAIEMLRQTPKVENRGPVCTEGRGVEGGVPSPAN